MVDQTEEGFTSVHVEPSQCCRDSPPRSHLCNHQFVCNHSHNHVTTFCNSGRTHHDISDMTTFNYNNGLHHISTGVQNISHVHVCSIQTADVSYSTTTRSQSYDSGLVADIDSCTTCTQHQEMDLPAQCLVGSMPNGMPAAHTLAAARNIREQRNKSFPGRSNSLPMINTSRLEQHKCTSASDELLDAPRTSGSNVNPQNMLNMSSDSGLDSSISLPHNRDSYVHTALGSQNSCPAVVSSPDPLNDVLIINLDAGMSLSIILLSCYNQKCNSMIL